MNEDTVEPTSDISLSDEARRWLEENREAIESYNAYIEMHGVFSDGLRSF